MSIVKCEDMSPMIVRENIELDTAQALQLVA